MAATSLSTVSQKSKKMNILDVFSPPKTRKAKKGSCADPLDGLVVMECDECDDRSLLPTTVGSEASQQAAKVGLSYVCNTCKLNAQVRALTELVKGLLEDKKVTKEKHKSDIGKLKSETKP